MTTYEVLVYGAAVLVAVGVPGLDALLNWLYPLTPEQEEARRLAIQRSRRV
jgi:hypothetical protein